MNKLFVYGIFLDEDRRQSFGMSRPEYATVQNFATTGGYIVQAIHVDGATLTGLLVSVDPKRWGDIDDLESGYDRIVVETTTKEKAYMYAAKGQQQYEN